MFQKFLLAAAIAGGAVPAFAQSANPNHHSLHQPFAARMHPATQQALAQQFSRAAQAQKGAGAAEQLIATSYYYGTPATLADSVRYIYSGTRTSLLDNNNLNSYIEDYSPDAELEPFAFGNYYINFLQYDSSFNYGLDTGNMIYLSGSSYKLYDAANQPTLFHSRYYSGGFGNNGQSQYLISNNAAGNPQHVTQEDDTSAALTGAYVPQYITGIAYNGAGQRTLDTNIYPLVPDTNYTAYGYNAAGLLDTVSHFLLTGGPALNDYRNHYTYDAAGRLIQARQQSYNGTGWDDNYLDTFAYTGAALLYTYNASYDLTGFLPGTTPTTPEFAFYASLNAIGAYDTVTILENDGSGTLLPSALYALTYNANAHLETFNQYDWNGFGFEPTPTESDHFYYQPQSSSSIANAPAAGPAVLYPNPAGNTLYVAATGSVSIAVYNATGQLLLQQTGTANGAMPVNIAPLPAGTYAVESRSAQGLQRGKFVKK